MIVLAQKITRFFIRKVYAPNMLRQGKMGKDVLIMTSTMKHCVYRRSDLQYFIWR